MRLKPIGGYPPVEEETLLATPRGEDEFRIESVPQWAPDLCRGDIVHTLSHQGRRFIDRIVAEGGHSTIRVVLLRASKCDAEGQREERLAVLAARTGAELTHTEVDGLYAIDVPAHADYSQLEAALVAGRDSGAWDLEFGALAAGHQAQSKFRSVRR